MLTSIELYWYSGQIAMKSKMTIYTTRDAYKEVDVF